MMVPSAVHLLYAFLWCHCIGLSSSNNISCVDSLCQNQTIYCVENEDCHIECNERDACWMSQIHCPLSADCHIFCGVDRNTCDDMLVNATQSSKLSIVCADNECDDMQIYCPSTRSKRGDQQCILQGPRVLDRLVFHAEEGFHDVNLSHIQLLSSVMYCGDSLQYDCAINATQNGCSNENRTCESHRTPTTAPTTAPPSNAKLTVHVNAAPTSNPTLSPTQTYNDADTRLEFYLYYNDSNGINVIIANWMSVSLQSTFDRITGNSNHDDDTDWETGGILNVTFCVVFNEFYRRNYESSPECSRFSDYGFDPKRSQQRRRRLQQQQSIIDPTLYNAQYVAYGTFGIYSDESIASFEEYVMDVFTSYLFRSSFNNDMRAHLDSVGFEDSFQAINILARPFDEDYTSDAASDTPAAEHPFQVNVILGILLGILVTLSCVVLVYCLRFYRLYNKRKQKMNNAEGADASSPRAKKRRAQSVDVNVLRMGHIGKSSAHLQVRRHRHSVMNIPASRSANHSVYDDDPNKTESNSQRINDRVLLNDNRSVELDDQGLCPNASGSSGAGHALHGPAPGNGGYYSAKLQHEYESSTETDESDKERKDQVRGMVSPVVADLYARSEQVRRSSHASHASDRSNQTRTSESRRRLNGIASIFGKMQRRNSKLSLKSVHSHSKTSVVDAGQAAELPRMPMRDRSHTEVVHMQNMHGRKQVDQRAFHWGFTAEQSGESLHANANANMVSVRRHVQQMPNGHGPKLQMAVSSNANSKMFAPQPAMLSPDTSQSQLSCMYRTAAHGAPAMAPNHMHYPSAPHMAYAQTSSSYNSLIDVNYMQQGRLPSIPCNRTQNNKYLSLAVHNEHVDDEEFFARLSPSSHQSLEEMYTEHKSPSADYETTQTPIGETLGTVKPFLRPNDTV